MSGLREEQIIDAVVAALRASSTISATVFKHRSLSLAEDQGELPAINVSGGDDLPSGDTGTDNFSFIDSKLDVLIEAYVSGTSEADIKTALANLRRRIHQALLADDTLGLPFVIGLHYAGARAPELQSMGEMLSGLRQINWQVSYRMNFADPGD